MEEDNAVRNLKTGAIPTCAYCPFGQVMDGVDVDGHLSPAGLGPGIKHIACIHPSAPWQDAPDGLRLPAIITEMAGKRPQDIPIPDWCPLPNATYQYDIVLEYIEEGLEGYREILEGLPKKKTLKRAWLEGKLAQLEDMKCIFTEARQCVVDVLLYALREEEPNG